VQRRHQISNFTVLGIDPGNTTGWGLVEVPHTVLFAGQINSRQALVDLINRYLPTTVVIEAFRLYPWKAQAQSFSSMIPAELIGVAKATCDALNISLIEQPASARNIITKRVLVATGGWKVTTNLPHARDAVRHALYYCRKVYPEAFLELLA